MKIHPIFRYKLFALQAGAALMCALLGQTSGAQTRPANTTESVTNPTAPVPAVTYRSVFKDTSLGVEKDTDNWRKANDEVGKFLRGHIDILKWEEQESTKAMKSTAEKPAMVIPAEGATPAPAATKPAAGPVHKH